MENTYTFWLIGLPSSGKTTLAASVREQFSLVHLDSDEIRTFLTPDANYIQDRETVYRSLIYMCKLLNEEGRRNVIVSATANLKKYRDFARETIKNYKEIYIQCPIQECETRDRKGLYAKAKNGVIKTVPMKIAGENDDYIKEHYGDEADIFDPPEKCDLVINTDNNDENSSIKKLSEYIGGKLFP